MNNFGGDWTKVKIEILVEYAKAYLTIMNSRRYFELMYFDGFAGSGFIVKDKKIQVETTVGAARRIIEISSPRSFNHYYFVEKDINNFKLLEANTKTAFPDKNIHATCDDCNKKLIDLAGFLRNPVNHRIRTLAYIDPCGMQVEWRSIQNLKGLPLDMWILVPTGLGVNRLLKRDGNISDAWLAKLEIFMGLKKEDILEIFYKKTPTLFDDITLMEKERNAVSSAAKLYESRLKEVFKYVSQPYELKNSSNSIMYHLFLTSNNKTAEKIGSEIVTKYNH
jgi:three-Cys-motif partner protein